MYWKALATTCLFVGVMAQWPSVKEVYSCSTSSLTGPLQMFTHDVQSSKVTCQYNGLVCNYNATSGISIDQPSTHWCPPGLEKTCS